MKKTIKRLFFLGIASSVFANPVYDLVIYGGSSAGVVAAVQGAKMGKSTVLIEPSSHVGGMTGSGLGWIDVGKPNTIGGLTKDFFHRIWKYYESPAVWIWEAKYPIKGQLNFLRTDQTMWVLEPHVAEETFDSLLMENGVYVVRNERLNRKIGVLKEAGWISQITMESGRVFKGRMFIDATYEGDLMAASGVSYIVGRESNENYNEAHNGLHPNESHFKGKKISPYRVANDPTSGLLPRIYPSLGGIPGEGDSCVQAYAYRMCLTDILANQVPIAKPENYQEEDYELLLRAVEAGLVKKRCIKFDLLPNRKTDSNNNSWISTDFIGGNWDYAEADYAKRQKIAKEHENWQKGLLWTLQHHPRVPNELQQFYSNWGLAKDEFIDNDNWPHRLYVREARRMISNLVISEQDVIYKKPIPDPIGLASYSLDSHDVKYYLDPDGFLAVDGGFYSKILNPFPISYRAIVPKREECLNLLVPICLSATHAAYGSIRMEPVFMVLGQSAATAACLSLDLNLPVQDLPSEVLCEKLIEDQQILNGIDHVLSAELEMSPDSGT